MVGSEDSNSIRKSYGNTYTSF